MCCLSCVVVCVACVPSRLCSAAIFLSPFRSVYKSLPAKCVVSDLSKNKVAAALNLVTPLHFGGSGGIAVVAEVDEIHGSCSECQ